MPKLPTALAGVVCALALIVTSCTGSDLSAQTPTATPSPQSTQQTIYTGPPVTPEAPNPFGLKWDWDLIDALAPGIASVAGGATFYEFEWCEVEPEPGTLHWEEVDDIVESTRRLGYDAQLKIRVGSCWVNNSEGTEGRGKRNKTPSRLPSDLDAYEQFVTEVVRRYSRQGVEAYAIENEPNATNFWQGTPAEYERLVRAAARAVRAADADAQVLDGGLSSVGYGVAIADAMVASGRGAEAVDFYNDYYARRFVVDGFVYPEVDSLAQLEDVIKDEPAQRAIEYLNAAFRLSDAIDVYQLHFYEQWEYLDAVTKLIRDGIGSTPIEAWEVGVAWPGDDYQPDDAAAETAQLLTTGLNLGIDRLIYLPASFTPGGLREFEIWRGLWDPDGSPRPAASAYEQMVKAAQGSDTPGAVIDQTDIEGRAFGHGDETRLVVWSRSGQIELKDDSIAEARDATGASALENAKVTVGATPVFVVVRDDLQTTLGLFQ